MVVIRYGLQLRNELRFTQSGPGGTLMRFEDEHLNVSLAHMS